MNKKVRILIVEDEFMISEDIAMRLSDFGFDVVGIASSAEEAIKILEKGLTDLAILDINIDGDKDGIELAKIIEANYKIPFIFLTSLASRSVVERAHDTHPSSYLLKPFNDRQVQIAIDMALLNFSQNKSVLDTQKNDKEATKSPSIIPMLNCLFLKKDTHFERVQFDDISYLCAESNYTTIYTKSGRYIFSSILKNFEEKLPSNIFIRVHRSYIVNVNAITGFEGNFLHIGKIHIPVSKSNKDDLFNAFTIVK